MTWLTKDLQNTNTAQWYDVALGSRSPESGTGTGTVPRGSATRTRYLEAIQTCLSALVMGPDGSDRASNAELRDAVVAEVGRRSTSTLYLLFRPESTNSLLGCHGADMRASQGCQDIVDYVIAEAKVWTHWPYRQGWLESLAAHEAPGRQFAAETLIRVLAGWAASNQLLAAELFYAPPVSAIEDLQIVCGRNADAATVTEILSRVLILAVDPTSPSPAAVLDSVHQDLMNLIFEQVTHVDRVVVDLGEALAAVEYLLPGMSDIDREELASEIGPQLAYVLKLLGREQ